MNAPFQPLAVAADEDRRLFTLAADIGAALMPLDEIYAAHGVTPEEQVALDNNASFQAMVEIARREWASIDSTEQRIRIKARLILEEALPYMFQMITDKQVPAVARVSAIKEIKEIGGVVKPAAESAGGGGPTLPSIVINLGAAGTAAKDVTIEATAVEVKKKVEGFVIDTDDYT